MPISPSDIGYRVAEILPHYPGPTTESFFSAIAIVGFGPKGLYTLERILSHAAADPKKRPVRVDAYNANEFFGHGPNYAWSQPDYLLLNYPCGKVNAFTQEPVQLLEDRPTLLEFIQKFSTSGKDFRPTDWVSRNVIGYYLNFVLSELLRHKPQWVEVNFVLKEIHEVQKTTSDPRPRYWIEGTVYDHLVLTTGHGYPAEDPYGTPTYLPLIYPIQAVEKLAGQTIGVLGLGLTFVDAVLALTEGKGGKFDAEFTYHPSGQEPQKIVAWSSSGQVMIPRTAQGVTPENEPADEVELAFLTPDFFKKFNEKPRWKPELETAFENEYQHQAQQHLGREMSFGELFYPDSDPYDQTQTYLDQAQGYARIASVWRQAIDSFAQVYNFAGLEGESQKHFDQKMRSGLSRMSFGMPDHNAKKLQGLVRAGILDYSMAKGPSLEQNGAKWELILGDEKIDLDAVINARIPRPDPEKDPKGLYANLVQCTHAQWAYNENYPLHILQINSEGIVPQESILLYGTPTEGWTLDNETLSRERYNFASSYIHHLFQA